MEENTKKTQKQTENAIGKENKIVTGVIWQQLLLFFFPILFGTFFQQLYNAADAVIVGRFVGKEALSAVGGGTGTLIQLLVGFFVGLSSGATVIISQYYGAKRAEMVGYAVHTSIAFSLVAGVGMMIVGITAAPWALRAMSTPEDILGDNLYPNLFPGSHRKPDLQYGSRHPAGCGGFQETVIFPDRQLPDEYCAGYCICHRTAYGCGWSRTGDHSVAGTQCGTGIVGADADEGYASSGTEKDPF